MTTIEIKSNYGVNVYVLNKIVSFGIPEQNPKTQYFNMYIEGVGKEANLLSFNTKKERDMVFENLKYLINKL